MHVNSCWTQILDIRKRKKSIKQISEVFDSIPIRHWPKHFFTYIDSKLAYLCVHTVLVLIPSKRRKNRHVNSTNETGSMKHNKNHHWQQTEERRKKFSQCTITQIEIFFFCFHFVYGRGDCVWTSCLRTVRANVLYIFLYYSLFDCVCNRQCLFLHKVFEFLIDHDPDIFIMCTFVNSSI